MWAPHNLRLLSKKVEWKALAPADSPSGRMLSKSLLETVSMGIRTHRVRYVLTSRHTNLRHNSVLMVSHTLYLVMRRPGVASPSQA